MISRNINSENNNLVWFKSAGKTIVYPEQNIEIESLSLDGDYTIDIEEVKFEKVNETTLYLPRRIFISYTSDKEFAIRMGDFMYNLISGTNEISFTLQDGDTFSTIVLTSLLEPAEISNLKIRIEELSKKIDAENYASNQDAIVNSLTQKLSTLKKELWYSYSFGMPLLEKNKTKVAIDSFVIEVVLNQEGVRSILEFSSKVEKTNYVCNIKLDTLYGTVSISI